MPFKKIARKHALLPAATDGMVYDMKFIHRLPRRGRATLSRRKNTLLWVSSGICYEKLKALEQHKIILTQVSVICDRYAGPILYNLELRIAARRIFERG